jgi:hypothetical protein
MKKVTFLLERNPWKFTLFVGEIQFHLSVESKLFIFLSRGSLIVIRKSCLVRELQTGLYA